MHARVDATEGEMLTRDAWMQVQVLRRAGDGTSDEDKELEELESELQEFVSITLEMLKEVEGESKTVGDGKQWKEGDQCMAKYYEDDEYYPAVVKRRLNDKQVLVEFDGYEGQETVAIEDLRPIEDAEREERGKDKQDTYQGVAAPKRSRTVVEGGQIRTEIPKKMQIRDGDDEATIAKKRKLIRSFKKAQRSQALDTITQEKQAAWKSFQQSKLSKGKPGFLTGKTKTQAPGMR